MDDPTMPLAYKKWKKQKISIDQVERRGPLGGGNLIPISDRISYPNNGNVS